MNQQKPSGEERHNGKEPYTNAVTNTEQQVYNSCSRVEPQRNNPNFTAAETEAKKPEGKQPATIPQAIFFPPTRTKETTLREQ
jgi:hypothetical protein